MASMELHNKWIVWFHDPSDNNWDLTSYKKIYEISTIKEFWNLYNKLDNKIIENSMFFVMRENIDPIWEHKDNINGGSWSFKIPKGNILETWMNISMALFGETINKTTKNIINGISISPKKNFCIIKIWNKNNK